MRPRTGTCKLFRVPDRLNWAKFVEVAFLHVIYLEAPS